MPSCRVTMCPSLPTGSPVLESHTRWARLARRSRVILDSRVGDMNELDKDCDMRNTPLCCYGPPLMHERLGVIPRAASALFEKLAGPPTLKRSGSSGLRTPTRYSAQSTMGLAALAKAQALASEDKSWQMKATYVEVGPRRLVINRAFLKGPRYTTSNYETSWSQNRYP